MPKMTTEEITQATNACMQSLKQLLGDNMKQMFVGVETAVESEFCMVSSMTKAETCASLMGFMIGHIQQGHGPDDGMLEDLITWMRKAMDERSSGTSNPGTA